MSTSLDVHCADCGAELEASISLSKKYSDSLTIDVSPCKRCTDEMYDNHKEELTELETMVNGLQVDVDVAAIEYQQLKDEYKAKFAKLNAIVEAMETCKEKDE